MTPKQWQKVQEDAKRVLREGPTRVVIDESGEAVAPRRAEKMHGRRYSTVVFLRRDGWSLGALEDLEAVAFRLWADEWVAFMRAPDWSVRPIDEYENRNR